MKKISILGANGYIARNLIYILNRDYPNYELTLYDRAVESVDGYKNYVAVNMIDRDSINKIDLSCDIVFMFVGKTGTLSGFDEYDSFIDSNEKALLNLIFEYRRQKSKARIIYPSTRLVYRGKEELQKENDEKEFKTVYAMNKYACEKYLEQFHNMFDVQYSIFRICVPYGTLVPNASSYGTAEYMIKKAMNGENISLYGDGENRRTFTYIEDICVTLIKGALSEKCANDTFNIGGEDLSLREMAELIVRKYNVGIDYIPWPEDALIVESGSTVFNSDKLITAIGKTTESQIVNWLK